MALRSLESLEPVDALYLSPHLDDVALSCPARLRDERAKGQRVLVASFFTRGDDGYLERVAEDRRALQILDVEGVHLGLPDAPFRRPAYRSYRALCIDRTPLEQDDLPQVIEALRGLLARTSPTRVVAPLGVGGHVDHRLLHRAAREVVEPSLLAFYEDRPYALVPGAAEARIQELGGATDAPAWPQLLLAMMRAPYVQTYMRAREVPALIARLRVRPSGEPRPWRAEIERHPLGERGVSIAVGLAYGSQWPDLFGGLARHERLLREASARLGCDGYAERFWRVG